jgi:hypothetical protein
MPAPLLPILKGHQMNDRIPSPCQTKSCARLAAHGSQYCETCMVVGGISNRLSPATSPTHQALTETLNNTNNHRRRTDMTMAEKYPQYYKAIPKGITEADTYVVNKMFPIQASDDPTGTVLHARKKLLVPGCRTGGKSFYDDIKEARDTLTRFLELMKPEQ